VLCGFKDRANVVAHGPNAYGNASVFGTKGCTVPTRIVVDGLVFLFARVPSFFGQFRRAGWIAPTSDDVDEGVKAFLEWAVSEVQPGCGYSWSALAFLLRGVERVGHSERVAVRSRFDKLLDCLDRLREI
jgi:hypothetical protein